MNVPRNQNSDCLQGLRTDYKGTFVWGGMGDRNGLYLGWDTDNSGTCMCQKLLKCTLKICVFYSM